MTSQYLHFMFLLMKVIVEDLFSLFLKKFVIFTGQIELRKQVQSLEDDFTDLMVTFADYLVEKRSSINDIKKYISYIPGYVGASIIPLWRKLKPELEQITEINEFLGRFNFNLWNFLDYEMLEYLIKKCKVHHMAQEIERYAAKIDDFKRTTLVIPFIKCWDGHKLETIPDYLAELEVKCDIKEDITKFTLSRLDVLRHYILKKCVPLLSHFASVLYYHKISEGCICVSWLFPERFSLSLKNRIQDISLILAQYHVVWVKINEECIYLQESISKLCKYIFCFNLNRCNLIRA